MDGFIKTDLSKLSEPRARTIFYQEVLTLIEKQPLKAIVNNAAVQILAPISRITPEDWIQTLSVNLLAPFYVGQMFLSELNNSSGSIINIASIHSSLTKPGFVTYATSKAALEGLTRSMAIELGPKIRVNAISPAAIRTAMLEEGFRKKPEKLKELGAFHPSGRIAEPDEIARLACFMSSDQCSFLTGSVIAAHGGIGNRLHDPD